MAYETKIEYKPKQTTLESFDQPFSPEGVKVGENLDSLLEGITVETMKTRPEYRLCYMFYELENGFKR
jgi:hypothetical protein